MSAGSGYEVSADGMRDVLRGLVDLTAQISGAVGQLGQLSIPGGCFGGVGTSVASGNVAVQAQSAVTLRALASVLQEINRRLNDTVDGYDRADRTIADTLALLSASDRLIDRAR